jgi:hypothetical protein
VSRSLAFECTEGDLLDAYRLHHCGVSGRALVLLVVYLLFAALALAWLNGHVDLRYLGLTFAALAGTILVVVCILKFLLSAVYLPRYARKIFTQQKTLHGTIAVEWDDVAMNVSTASSTARIKWSDCHAYRRSNAVILIYLSDALFHFIPTRSFSTPVMRDDLMSAITGAPVPQRTGRIFCTLERQA